MNAHDNINQLFESEPFNVNMPVEAKNEMFLSARGCIISHIRAETTATPEFRAAMRTVYKMIHAKIKHLAASFARHNNSDDAFDVATSTCCKALYVMIAEQRQNGEFIDFPNFPAFFSYFETTAQRTLTNDAKKELGSVVERPKPRKRMLSATEQFCRDLLEEKGTPEGILDDAARAMADDYITSVFLDDAETVKAFIERIGEKYAVELTKRDVELLSCRQMEKMPWRKDFSLNMAANDANIENKGNWLEGRYSENISADLREKQRNRDVRFANMDSLNDIFRKLLSSRKIPDDRMDETLNALVFLYVKMKIDKGGSDAIDEFIAKVANEQNVCLQQDEIAEIPSIMANSYIIQNGQKVGTIGATLIKHIAPGELWRLWLDIACEKFKDGCLNLGELDGDSAIKVFREFYAVCIGMNRHSEFASFQTDPTSVLDYLNKKCAPKRITNEEFRKFRQDLAEQIVIKTYTEGMDLNWQGAIDRALMLRTSDSDFLGELFKLVSPAEQYNVTRRGIVARAAAAFEERYFKVNRIEY